MNRRGFLLSGAAIVVAPHVPGAPMPVVTIRGTEPFSQQLLADLVALVEQWPKKSL